MANMWRSIVDALTKSWETRYLEGATDHADLERRINKLKRGTVPGTSGYVGYVRSWT